MSRIRSAVLWLVPLLLLISGCKKDDTTIGGQVRRQEYNRIISLSPATTEIVVQGLYKGKEFIGRTGACNFPAGIERFPIVTDKSGTRPDFEQIKKLKPNFIVVDTSLYRKSDIDLLKSMDPNNIEVYEYNPQNLAEYEKDLARIASWVHGETLASKIVDGIYTEVARDKANPIANPPKVALIMPGSAGRHYIDGVDSFQADIIKNAGAIPVGPKGNSFTPMDAESLIVLNPDVIITAGDPTSFATDSRLAGLKAIKNKKVFGIMQDIALRRGARVDRFLIQVRAIITGNISQ